MIDLLICEDQYVVLMGLKKLTESLGLPLGEIFLAQDAQTAYELFSQHRISLVITDIQMPGSSGLQLLQRMQKLREDFQAVIISGHNDFEYAKTAIHLGIEDYLLKPVDPEELRAALRRCIEKLSRHQKQRKFFSGILLEQLRDAWGGELPAESEAILLDADNRLFQAEIFGTVVFHIDRSADMRKLCGRMQAQLQKRFRHLLMCPAFGRSYFAIACLDNPDRLPELHAFLEQQLAQLFSSEHKGIFCGIGPAVDSIFGLKDAILQAEGALCRRFSVRGERNAALIWEPRKPSVMMAQTVTSQLCDSICSKLRLPEIHEIEPCVDKFFNSLSTHPALYQTLPEYLKQIDSFIQAELSEKLDMPLIRLTAYSDSLPQLKTQLKEALLELCRKNLSGRMANQDAVSVAIDYMKKNYQKPLTLTLLANVVSLNYAYFSNLFKARTGVSVTAYLQNIRIQKAKELLISTNDRIREVAHKTGFTDERYFEKLFKASEGMTPSGYREKLQSFTDQQKKTE